MDHDTRNTEGRDQTEYYEHFVFESWGSKRPLLLGYGIALENIPGPDFMPIIYLIEPDENDIEALRMAVYPRFDIEETDSKNFHVERHFKGLKYIAYKLTMDILEPLPMTEDQGYYFDEGNLYHNGPS